MNFTVNSYTTTGEIEINNPIAQEVVAGRDFVEIVARAATPVPPPDVQLTVRAKASGDWGGNEVDDTGITAGNGLRTRVRPVVAAALRMLATSGAAGNPATTTVAADAAAGATEIQVASATGFAANDQVQIDGAVYTIAVSGLRVSLISRLRPGPGPDPRRHGDHRSRRPRGMVVGDVPATGTMSRAPMSADSQRRHCRYRRHPLHDFECHAGSFGLLQSEYAVPAGDTGRPGHRPAETAPLLIPPIQTSPCPKCLSALCGAIVERTRAQPKKLTVDSIAGDAVTLSATPQCLFPGFSSSVGRR